MSTVNQPSITPGGLALPAAVTSGSAAPQPVVPPLANGDRLTRHEFERRYRAMPNAKKAELIEGVVYMPSPVSFTFHGEPHAILLTWLGYYVAKTPGLRFGDNATSRLDEDNEPQPDAMLFLPPGMGSGARIDEDDYVIGAPDLVCEIAASSASIDLHAKLNAYRRNGVKEYLVVRTYDAAVDWFELVDGNYRPLPTDDAGRISSKRFPGLALEAAALLTGDLPKLFAAVDAAIVASEHAQFAANVAKATGGAAST